MAMWPSNLPALVHADDYAETWIDGVRRTEMQVGPPKTRRIFTRMRRKVRRSFLANKVIYQDFWDYLDNDLAGGAAAFSVEHPITKIVTTFKMAEPPSVSPIGVDAFRITLVLEEQ